MEFRTDRLSHPPTLSLKRGGESGFTKSVGCNRVHEHLVVQTGIFLWIFFVLKSLLGHLSRLSTKNRVLWSTTP